MIVGRPSSANSVTTGQGPVNRFTTRIAGVVTVVACIAIATSGAVVTTPLFPVYAEQWQLSSLTTTSVYAAYIIGTLTSLIFFGRLADRIGRKPVLLAGLLAAALGTLVLLASPDALWLFPGRVLQGLTVGLISSAGSAALADITRHPSRAAMLATASNVGGMAIGTLLTGLIAQYLPWPLHLPYLVYLAVLALVLVATLRLREPGRTTETSTVSASPVVVSKVPLGAFITAAATTLVGFSSVALVLSLGPKLTLQWSGSTNLAFGGMITCITCLAAGTTQLLARTVPPRTAIVLGLAVIVTGIGALLGAGAAHTFQWLLLAALLIGIGYGFVFLGGLSAVQRIIPADRRSTWLSMYFITAYVGMSMPAIGIGFLTDRLGLLSAIEIFGAYAAVTAVIIIVASFAQPRLNGLPATQTESVILAS